MAINRSTAGLSFGGEPADEDIMNLIQQQYGTIQTAAPAAPAVQVAAPSYSPIGPAAQVSSDVQSVAGLAHRFQNELAQLGWTGGDPVVYDYTPGGESGQDFRATAVGVNPEFEQFMQGKNLQVALDPSGGGYRVSLLAGGQPIGQYQESKSGFDRFMDTLAPLAAGAILTLATAGAASAALTALVPGISAASAGAIGRALAPSIVQATQTGQFNIEQAARNVVVGLVAPSIGAEVSATVQDLYGNATGGVLSPAIERAISNAAASAAATAIQQGADSSDIGRNLLAGAISSAVGTTLNQAGVDPSIAAGAGRAAGSYISTGSGVQALVDGVTRGLTFEQQRQAVQEERNARNIERAYQDPSRAQDVVSPGSVEAAVDNIGSSAAQDVVSGTQEAQRVETTGQAQAAGPTDQDIQAAIQRDLAVTAAPAAAPATQVQVTGTQQAAEQPFTAVAAPAAAPAAATPAVAPAVTPAVAAPAQQIVTTGTQAGTVTDQDVLSQIQPPAVAPVTAPAVAAPATAAPAPAQQVVTTGAREQVAEDPFAGVTEPPPRPPGREAEVQAAAPKFGRIFEDVPTFTESIPVTGAAEPTLTDEDIFAYLDQFYAPPAPAPATAPTQQVTTIGRRPGQEITVAGTAPTSQDVDTSIRSGESGMVTVTGQRPPQELTVVGQAPTDEDILAYISEPPAAEPAPSPPAPTPAPAPGQTTSPVYPTDIFSFVRNGRSTPLPVARLAAMDFPMSRTMGVSGIVPAGKLEPGGSTKPRQSVWNEASLRLKDALGL
jgi:hypothetical protein